MEPPRLLSRPAEAKPAPPPIHAAEPLAAVRRRWAQFSAATGRPAPADPVAEGGENRGSARVPGGVRAKVKARVATAAAGVQAQDLAMTGDLVGAIDALARRIDELTGRITDLEALVQEVVELTSEELARVQIAFDAARDDPGSEGPASG